MHQHCHKVWKTKNLVDPWSAPFFPVLYNRQAYPTLVCLCLLFPTTFSGFPHVGVYPHFYRRSTSLSEQELVVRARVTTRIMTSLGYVPDGLWSRQPARRSLLYTQRSFLQLTKRREDWLTWIIRRSIDLTQLRFFWTWRKTPDQTPSPWSLALPFATEGEVGFRVA